MKHLVCKIVGHQAPDQNLNRKRLPDEEYATLHIDHVDACGQTHARVFADCARCGAEFLLARVHVPTKVVVDE